MWCKVYFPQCFFNLLRSFIAVSILPEDSLSSFMESIEPLKGSKVPGHRVMHLTLAFLGDITEDEKGMLCRKISEVKFRKFTMKTTHIDAFPDIRKARVAYVGVESPEVMDLHGILNEKLPEKFRETRKFVPHLTVSRFKGPTDIRGLLRENENTDFGTYEVDRLTLYRSDLTPDGAVYTEMCSVQLM